MFENNLIIEFKNVFCIEWADWSTAKCGIFFKRKKNVTFLKERPAPAPAPSTL